MADHLSSALTVAIIGGIVDLDSTATWQFMISQPIVAAPLTGLFLGMSLGDARAGLKLGLMVGTILQLVWIEKLPLGMNVPPDAALASVLSVALGFLAGHQYETYVEREVCNTVALLFSVALGLFGRSLDILNRRWNSAIDRWVSKGMVAGKTDTISIGHSLGGVLSFTKAFLFCFLIAWLGVEPLRFFTKSLNFVYSSGFIVIQGLLPAIGFAVLASMCIQSKPELKAVIAGIVIFTILPASIWLIFPAACTIGWWFSRSTDVST